MPHTEARRLEWKSRRVPIRSLLAVIAAATMLASTVFTILAQSPTNPVP
jgi:hypothetical protein